MRALERLPDLEALETRCRALAALDAMLCPEWEFRYFSFDETWDEATGERMASMRNGSGDEWFLLLCSAGAALKGFDHERAPGCPPAGELLAGVPPEFQKNFLGEPAFSMEIVTFCAWRRAGDATWTVSPERDDGSEELLSLVVGQPEDYKRWAEEYFETEVDLETVRRAFAGNLPGTDPRTG